MLSPESLERIDREIAKYPPDRRSSAVMAALAVAQDEKGWLPTDVVATFYEMFNTRPTGKYKLTICTNLPCALQSASQAALHLKQKLGIDFNETTPDGQFTLKEGECFGACGDAPVVLVNNKRLCSWMKPEALDGLLAELSAKAKR